MHLTTQSAYFHAWYTKLCLKRVHMDAYDIALSMQAGFTCCVTLSRFHPAQVSTASLGCYFWCLTSVSKSEDATEAYTAGLVSYSE